MIASVLLILLAGFIFGRLFEKARVPGIIGMIAAGILIGRHGVDLIEPSVYVISKDLRLIALMIILLRAGLGINRELLNKVGLTALKTGIVPCLVEGFSVSAAAHLLLGFEWRTSLVLGFVLAAVSPALIIPRMLELKEDGWGMKRGVPVIVLAAASIDNVVAVTLFSVFFNLASGGASQPAWFQFSMVPIQIAGGIAIGVLAGVVLSRVLRSAHIKKTEVDELILAITAGLSAYLISRTLHVAGLIAIMTVGFIILEKDEEIAHRIAGMLKKVWVIAEIFLFVLIGIEVDVRVMLGAGLIGLAVIAAGVTARFVSAGLVTAGTDLRARERLFIAISNIPKATVQAAVGGIPYAAGMKGGEIILAVSVLSIIATSFFGTLFMERSFQRLLKVFPPER